MRILVVSIYSPGSETGVARASELISKYLSERNEVMYLCLGDSYKKMRKSKTLTYLTIPAIPIKQGNAPKLNKSVVESIYRELDEFSPEIIHAQNVIFTGLISLVWAQKNHIPFVLTLHSQPTNAMKYLLPNRSSEKHVLSSLSLTAKYTKTFLKHTDLLITLNDSVEKSVMELTKNVKTKRIHNGIDLQKYFDFPIKKQDDTYYFLYLGMYMGRKNQEYLVKVFSHLPNNYKLLLHGNKKTGSDYVKKLNKLKSDLKAKNVKIGGFIRGWSYDHTLKKTDYFVSASLKEVQSFSIIESLASGTPVIGLSNETIDELVNDSNGLVFPTNTAPSEFAKELEKFVINNRPNYKKLAKGARNSVRDFEIRDVAKELENTYKEVIIRKKSESQVSMIDNIIPKKLETFFDLKKANEKRKGVGLRFLIQITILISLVLWPVAKLFRMKRSV